MILEVEVRLRVKSKHSKFEFWLLIRLPMISKLKLSRSAHLIYYVFLNNFI